MVLFDVYYNAEMKREKEELVPMLCYEDIEQTSVEGFRWDTEIVWRSWYQSRKTG